MTLSIENMPDEKRTTDGTISRHTDFEQPILGEDVLPGFAFDLWLLLR
jgi:hypothetical protein